MSGQTRIEGVVEVSGKVVGTPGWKVCLTPERGATKVLDVALWGPEGSAMAAYVVHPNKPWLLVKALPGKGIKEVEIVPPGHH